MPWYTIFIVIVAFCAGFIMWPSNERNLKIALSTGAIIGSLVLLGCYIPQLWPVDHIKIEKVQRKYVNPPKEVIKTVEKIVYIAPGADLQPVDVVGVCKGKYPIEIVRMTESGSDDTTTWVTGRVVGRKILVSCGQPGAFISTGLWHVGDIVQFVRGEPQ